MTLDAALAPFEDQPVRSLEVPVSAARFRNQRCYVMALYARGAIADSPRTLECFSRNARSDPLYRLVQFMHTARAALRPITIPGPSHTPSSPALPFMPATPVSSPTA